MQCKQIFFFSKRKEAEAGKVLVWARKRRRTTWEQDSQEIEARSPETRSQCSEKPSLNSLGIYILLWYDVILIQCMYCSHNRKGKLDREKEAVMKASRRRTCSSSWSSWRRRPSRWDEWGNNWGCESNSLRVVLLFYKAVLDAQVSCRISVSFARRKTEKRVSCNETCKKYVKM